LSLSGLDTGTLLEVLREAYYVVDGLWFLCTEESHGFNEALRIDLKVWERYGRVMARRVKRRLQVQGNDVRAIIATLKVFYDMEGWTVNVDKEDEDEAVLSVKYCPWYDYLEKARRREVVKAVCPQVCLLIFNSWASVFNEDVKVEASGSIPNCVFHFKRKSNPPTQR